MRMELHKIVRTAMKFNWFIGGVTLLLLVGGFIFLYASAGMCAEAGVNTPDTKNAGLGFIAAALSTGLATLGAGIAVGMVGSSAMGAVSEKPELMGRSLIYIGLAEGISIYGLVISIMILFRI